MLFKGIMMLLNSFISIHREDSQFKVFLGYNSQYSLNAHTVEFIWKNNSLNLLHDSPDENTALWKQSDIKEANIKFNKLV